MPYYVMKEMPDIKGTGERVVYPSLATIESMSTEELAREIASCSGFNVGDIEGILKQTSIEMAHQMAQGRSIKLDGIGTFTPALAMRKDVEREEAGENGQHRNAQSIEVGSVNYRVDMSLVRRINGRCTLSRAPWKPGRSSKKYTPEQRLELTQKYLEENPYLTVYEYQKLTGLLRTAATNELKEWANQPNSGIDIAGRGVHRVYVKKKEGEE